MTLTGATFNWMPPPTTSEIAFTLRVKQYKGPVLGWQWSSHDAVFAPDVTLMDVRRRAAEVEFGVCGGDDVWCRHHFVVPSRDLTLFYHMNDMALVDAGIRSGDTVELVPQPRNSTVHLADVCGSELGTISVLFCADEATVTAAIRDTLPPVGDGFELRPIALGAGDQTSGWGRCLFDMGVHDGGSLVVLRVARVES